jgi:hypothetical protein
MTPSGTPCPPAASPDGTSTPPTTSTPPSK